jgi:hypothetical protein
LLFASLDTWLLTGQSLNHATNASVLIGITFLAGAGKRLSFWERGQVQTD